MNITLIYALKYRLKTNPEKYDIGENTFNGYLDEEVSYPMNHIIQAELSKEDDVNIILVETVFPDENTDDNVALAKEEITRIIDGHCRSYKFTIVSSSLASTKKELNQLYLDLISSIDSNSFVYTDVTYGPKYIPIIFFCTLNYAEKYLKCSIKQLLYGRHDHTNNTGTILDFTSLYLLNTFGSIFDGSKESFDRFTSNLIK